MKKINPLFLALLFHGTGVLGILFTPYKDWFVSSTPLVLLFMFFLLANTQLKAIKNFLLSFAIAFVISMGTEIIGVNTGLLFGQYQYGPVLGPKILGVPWLIGLNWFVIVYCSGSFLVHSLELMKSKFNIRVTATSSTAMIVLGGAAMATFFDFILEPVAVKLNFWTWNNGDIPLYNYLCWFLVSAVLLRINLQLKQVNAHVFASSLLIIQAVFFLMLHLFL
ncbi:MAG: carotenoid biosynthesis protein [Flavobacteriaceae bacterium]